MHATSVGLSQKRAEQQLRGSCAVLRNAGQEVTQYTYFQQAAGRALPVPAVEITYGLERILAALQVCPCLDFLRV